MKFRIAFLIVIATLLSACNFTLAEDITPPPDYVPPTPAPTLGPLFPAQAPSVENGAAIYAEKCLPCHGEKGLGDGPQGIQLGVTVSAFGLPEIARPASPAQWYATVTRGRMDRYMPPFSSLSDQERWDVIAYINTLHTSNAEIQKGKQLFETNCANCSTDFFKNQEKMSALSDVELARLVKQGNTEVKAFGQNLSDSDLWATAAYLRSLSFDATRLAQATVAPVTETSATAEGGTPPAGGTAVGTEQASAGSGIVSGTIDNKTGAALPSDLKATLHIFEHGQDQNAGPQEVDTQETAVTTDGKFIFENIELKVNRIFVAEVDVNGVNSQSDFVAVKAGDTSIVVPKIVLHPTTQDLSVLRVDNEHMFFDFTGQTDVVQLITVYTITNTSDKTLIVTIPNSEEIPFIPYPSGAQKLGYQTSQDSAQFIGTDNGFAVPPSDKTYGLITISGYPKGQPINVSQKIGLPVSTVSILVPEGVKAEGSQLTEEQSQSFQGTALTSYSTPAFKEGDTLTFTLSGTPKDSTGTASTTTSTSSKNTLLIGAGGLGLALILAGGWMYMRDRKRAPENDEDENEGEEEEESEFDTSEDVMDAILALDDLHRAKKISDETYHKRRDELKEVLKGMM